MPRQSRFDHGRKSDCEGLDRDVIEMITGFLGTQVYISVASVSTQWSEGWGQQPKVTSRAWAVQSRSCLDWARACGLEIWDSPCLFAAAKGRLDVLQHAIALGYSREGMPICEWAAGGGHLEVVKWCRTNGYPWGWSSLRAAEGGHLEVLKWCVAHGCPTTVRRRPHVDGTNFLSPRGHYRGKHQHHEQRVFDVFIAAAKGGHLETVKWCREQGYSWSWETSDMAAEGGHLDVLRWLRSKGCSWGLETMRGAARAGHLEILEWCKGNGCPWDHRTVPTAVESGDLEVVKWCFANDPDGGNHVDNVSRAAAQGTLELVQLMRANGCSWGDQTCYLAACGGHLEVLKWCVANGCPWSHAKVHSSHAFNASVSMMIWAASNGCPWMMGLPEFNDLCQHAARTGNLEVLQWFATCQPLRIPGVSREAATKGQVHVLEWLRASGRLSDRRVDTSLCTSAARSGSLETVKWCRANNLPWGPKTTDEAMASGNLELLQWCRANGCPWGTETIRISILQGDIEALVWCLENNCPLDRSTFVDNCNVGDDEATKWYEDYLLRKHGEREQEVL